MDIFGIRKAIRRTREESEKKVSQINKSRAERLEETTKAIERFKIMAGLNGWVHIYQYEGDWYVHHDIYLTKEGNIISIGIASDNTLILHDRSFA